MRRQKTTDFNTMLYRQNLWNGTASKFNNGASILKIDVPPAIKPNYYSPFTNTINGIPQWKLPGDDNYAATIIKELEKKR